MNILAGGDANSLTTGHDRYGGTITMPKISWTCYGRRFMFHIYNDASGNWRWRLWARNGRICGDSGEGYVKKTHAIDMVMAICSCDNCHVVIEHAVRGRIEFEIIQ